jgi:hypothetical protein
MLVEVQFVPTDRLTRMNPLQKIELRHLYSFCVLGLCLIGIVFFTPNPADQPRWAFFQVAKMSTWRQLYDWPAAWCSLKIIVLSLGLFLVIDAIGSLLALRGLKSMALSVFFLHIVPCLGILVGGYYLVKALL